MLSSLTEAIEAGDGKTQADLSNAVSTLNAITSGDSAISLP